MGQCFEYYAFISYKREDEKWAKWLQNKLEGYRLPSIIRKETPRLPKRIRPVFRDKTDLGAGILTDSLRKELEKSQYLIVICSPQSAKSEWVGKEISVFIEMGRADHIIPFIVSGKPNSNDEQECFHAVIKEKIPEILGINIQETGKQQAFVKTVAKLLDLRFDELWNRHKRQQRKQRLIAAAIAFCILAGMMEIWKYNKPFDMQLAFNETSLHSEKLGFPDLGGTVSICFNDRDTLVKTVKDLGETICFNDIPGRYRGRKSTLFFRLWGFADVDTVLVLQTNISLPVARDGTYGTVQGYVRNALTDNFVEGVKVEIAAQLATTDKNGYFAVNIPLERQQKNYEATLLFEGKTQKTQAVYPMQKEENLINTLYIE